MFVGIVIVLAGLTLATVPVESARFANWLRMVPYSSDEQSLAGYRRTGWVIFGVGVTLAVILR